MVHQRMITKNVWNMVSQLMRIMEIPEVFLMNGITKMHIKKLNKQVIHLAGATQILFGIRGKRWDIRPEMQQYFNEHWTRPLESERPKDAQKVEGGCYW